MSAWVGPLGASHDFIFQAISLEVKALASGNKMAKISSAYQLECDHDLYLLGVTIDKASDQAKSLNQIVSETSNMIGSTLRSTFLERVALAGYEPRDEYSEEVYSVGGVEAWHVSNNFPRLITSELPDQILSCKYQLDLARCKDWQLDNFKEVFKDGY
jgi:hypothetical protein